MILGLSIVIVMLLGSLLCLLMACLRLNAHLTESEAFRLPNGLKVGSDIKQVEALMGKPVARRITSERNNPAGTP